MIRKMTTMDLSNALHLIIQTAVVKNRRLRFIDLIKTERGLHKFVAQLDHFEHYIINEYTKEIANIVREKKYNGRY